MPYLGFPPIFPPIFVVIVVAVLVLAATLRLTRLVTSDALGYWLIRKPLEGWADDRELAFRAARQRTLIVMTTEYPDMTDEARRYLEGQAEELDRDEPMSWQARLVSGLSCPHCIGFWIGAVLVVLSFVLLPLAVLSTVWLAVLTILALSYAVGHLSARLD